MISGSCSRNLIQLWPPSRCSLTRCALLHRGRLRVNGHQLLLGEIGVTWQLKIRATLKKDTLKLDRDWIMKWESTMENTYQQLKNYENLFIKFCGHIYLPLFLYVFLRGKHNVNSIKDFCGFLWYYLTKHRWFVIPPSPTAAKAVVSQSAGGCLRAFARPFTWRSLPRVACLQISPWIIYRQVLRPDR
jgi:hypothetical protein